MPQRVYDMDPNISLILIICDPIKRIISHHTHLLSNTMRFGSLNVSSNLEDEILDKNGNVKIEPEIDEVVKKTNIALSFRSSLVKDSVYVMHLKRWLEYFQLKQILVLNGDEFIQNPYIVMKKIEKFLNIEHFFRPDFFTFNSIKRFYCLSSKVKVTGNKTNCLDSTKGRKYIGKINSVLEKKLKKFFRPYNQELFKILKQKNFWSY